jgi:hypothetical protein
LDWYLVANLDVGLKFAPVSFSPLTGIHWIGTVVFPDFCVSFGFELTCTAVLSASRPPDGGLDLTFRVIEHLDFLGKPGVAR